MSTSQPYILYGTDHSYFTGKVRPYLRYKQIPFQERQASLWVYQRLILPRTGVRFIPVVQTPEDVVLQDTTVIIDELESRFPARPVYPQGPRQKLLALLLELYADEWFLLPAMHYRWSYLDQHEKYLMTEFGRIAGVWLPGPLRRAFGRQISKPFKGSLKFLGINARTGPAIEAWFRRFLGDFEAHLECHDFLLGSRPCLADFALAGPLYAHLWKDPYSKRIVEGEAPNTVAWLRRINREDQPEGEFLADDEVPETLMPIMQHLFAEQWPIVEATVACFAKWHQENPDRSRVSRALGWHEFKLGETREQRLAFSNVLWMAQRPLGHYAALSDADKQTVDPWLSRCGGLDALQLKISPRIERQHNRLVVAADSGS